MAGLLDAGASVTRYAMSDIIPDEKLKNLCREFHDIDETHDEISVGWVSISNMFRPVHAAFTSAAPTILGFALRVDRRKVPNSVLKKLVMKEELRIKTERELPKLSRQVRVEIKERIYQKLLRITPADAAVYSVLVDVNDRSVYLGSTTQAIRDLFEAAFLESFDVQLSQQVLYTRAEALLSADELKKLDNLTGGSF